MSTFVVEDALGLSATTFNRVYASSATSFQVQINATTRIVINGTFGTPTQPPYDRTFDAPQVGSISSFEIWQTSNITSGAAIQGRAVISGTFARLETLFEEAIIPADCVRSAIPRNGVVPLQAAPVDEGTATYFDIAQTDGGFLRFLGTGLRYDSAGFPESGRGSLYGVIELDANKQDFGTGYSKFVSASLGEIRVTPLQVYMGLFDDVLVSSFYAQLFTGAGLSIATTGALSSVRVPFGNYFQDVSLRGTAAAERIDGYFGADTIVGGGGNDVLVSRGLADVLDGGAGHDTLNGGADADRLTGGTGTDVLYGGAGVDRLSGGAGADRLYGGLQADRLTGGAGKDALYGGGGADVFIFTAESDSGPSVAARDSVFGFDVAGRSVLDLRVVDAVRGGVDQAFRLDRGGAFTAGELRILASGVDRIVQMNTDGDTAVEMVIFVRNAAGLSVDDMML